MNASERGIWDNNVKEDFRKNVFYEEIYAKYNITEKDLIGILKRSIRGKYDYKRILSGGIEAQKQFNFHLRHRYYEFAEEKFILASPYLDGRLVAETEADYVNYSAVPIGASKPKFVKDEDNEPTDQ